MDRCDERKRRRRCHQKRDQIERSRCCAPAPPTPPQFASNFLWRGFYRVPDLGITVPLVWFGKNGDVQMIAGCDGSPVHFTNIIFQNHFYTYTFQWPGLQAPFSAAFGTRRDSVYTGCSECFSRYQLTICRTRNHWLSTARCQPLSRERRRPAVSVGRFLPVSARAGRYLRGSMRQHSLLAGVAIRPAKCVRSSAGRMGDH